MSFQVKEGFEAMGRLIKDWARNPERRPAPLICQFPENQLFAIPISNAAIAGRKCRYTGTRQLSVWQRKVRISADWFLIRTAQAVL